MLKNVTPYITPSKNLATPTYTNAYYNITPLNKTKKAALAITLKRRSLEI